MIHIYQKSWQSRMIILHHYSGLACFISIHSVLVVSLGSEGGTAARACLDFPLGGVTTVTGIPDLSGILWRGNTSRTVGSVTMQGILVIVLACSRAVYMVGHHNNIRHGKRRGRADNVRRNFWELWKFLVLGRLFTLIL